MTRNRIPLDMMANKKNSGLSTAYEDAPWDVCVVNKQARPISQAVVKQIKIKMKARKLCKRNNVLYCVREKLGECQIYGARMFLESLRSKSFKNVAKPNILQMMLVVLVASIISQHNWKFKGNSLLVWLPVENMKYLLQYKFNDSPFILSKASFNGIFVCWSATGSCKAFPGTRRIHSHFPTEKKLAYKKCGA